MDEDEKEFKPVQNISDLTDKTLSQLIKSTPSEIIEQKEEDTEFIEEDAIEKDFEEARYNIKNIIEQGNKALETMIDLTNVSEHPRFFEVTSTMINTMLNANKDMMELHERKRKAKGTEKNEEKEIPKVSNNTQNNTVFVGSNKEFQEMMKNRLQNKNDK